MKNRVAVSALASGSKGNSIYIEGPEGALLVDAGLSAREILRRLDIVGASPRSLAGILVTHDHSDHLRGVRVLARRLGLAVYGTACTIEALEVSGEAATVPVRSGEVFTAAGFSIKPFSLPHDAVDPVGYILEIGGVKLGIATDLGCETALVRRRLAGCDMIVLESNYDEKMLLEGPYPWFLKQRIRSRSGHLSNEASSCMLSGLLHPGLQRVLLAHLSEVNNRPEAALGETAAVLGARGNGLSVTAAGMAEPTPIMIIES